MSRYRPISRTQNRNSIRRRIRSRVIHSIHQHRMFQAGDAVLAGVSGGPDSAALIHILHRLASRFSIRLGIGHLHHGLRGEDADEDARFVEKLARTLNLPFHSENQDVEAYRRRHRLSPEDAARRVRYDFFERIRREHGYDRVALGHHADDNAELVLMNLLRGSGKTGLSGIPPVREDRFVRPLIGLTRAEILDYLESEGISCRTDASNTDIRYLRNRIRRELIPLLQRDYQPEISDNLNRLADILRSEEEWIEGIIVHLFDRCLLHAARDEAILSAPALQDLPTAPRRRIIRMGIERVKGDLRRITFTHVEDICHILNRRHEGRKLDLPDRIRVAATGETLRISKEKQPLRRKSPQSERVEFDRDIPGPGTYEIPKIGSRLRLSLISRNIHANFRKSGQYTAFFDMDKTGFPLHVRNIRPGDRFTPLGMTGTRKLAEFFIDQKIPQEERIRCPLLLCQEKIIWVVGHRMDDSVKVSPDTERVLTAELLLA